ncbi:PAS domain S-box-containing protein [Oryzisolibacter propanilivorax]|uniref:histidine kinase n=1 Tax=Oryzisolibacter propanilivorax TaxID=1527607 RepID=A0A1G9P5V0_9BURK|nr:ATP-binding protein [Oryzisolibacter propanilivorax]SDL93913.1 PAS domain S-box-containing protein [Oryzisolibacter propanilivorax]
MADNRIAPTQFPHAPGVMSAKVRAFDWASHPLGPIEGWPQALRVVLELMLASHFPKCLVWGEHRTTFYNDAYRPILGDKPEALGQPFDRVWYETWGQVEHMAERALLGEATFMQDMPLVVQRFGYPEQTYFTFCFSPVRDDVGVVGGFAITVIETTQMHHLQQQLRAEASSLEQQVALRTADRDRLWTMADAIMIVARFDGVIAAVNPGWTAALGWSEADTLGRHVRAFVFGGDTAELDAEGTMLRTGTQRRQVRMRFMRRDGQVRTIAWSVVAADGFLHAVGRDETEDLERAQQLSEAQERLRQGQKMEAIGQLTGGIAHDFNNMLQGIVLPLQLMQRRLQQGRTQEVQGYIDAALGSARRAASLTQRLLAFSRRQPLDVRATDVAATLSGLETMLRSSCGENILLDLDIAPGLWNVRTDLHQFENAVLNLAINARDAMPVGGRLRVATANAPVRAEHAIASGSSGMAAGEYVRVSVSDTGTGMPAEVIERAFDPFFTTKPIGQGTGLGLSMIYGYMRQTGGAVEIESSIGDGTTVHLYLPRSEDGPQDEAPATLDTHDHERRRDAVLVVEDEATVRSMVVELLRDMGFQIMQAASGTEAMALLSGALHFDLLITDVGLPGPNGRQVADMARERLPSIRVLLMTGYAERAAMSEQSLLGQDMELLVKPFDAPAFVRKVQAIMGVDDAATRS